ncbi:unnamed protein product [Auanema sp. JU1783]|nr:unnamed protein product [Auanema sp. JU1783]
MKLFLLLSALCAVALAQITCERYCNGALEAPNCIPPRFDVWQTKPCFARCVSNCNSNSVNWCAFNRYKCCMTAAAFNNTNKCWPQWNAAS